MEPTLPVLENTLECKNCSQPLGSLDKFCSNCAAKVIGRRITVKNLFSDFANNVFGWDNRFFVTLRTLILRPKVIFTEYISGTRKKYMNPFTFLGLGAALSLFVFNFFAEDYLALNIESNRQSVEIMANMMEKQLGENFDGEAYRKDTMAMVTKLSSFMLKYFNLLVIIFLPFYTFFAFLTYRKPYNYGEHLIINSYIQGLNFLVTSIVFTISVFTDPSVYIIAIISLIIYYTYAYGNLYRLSIAEAILKLFKFFAILISAIILLMILSITSGFLLGRLF